ncbi:MAG: hypothetical protein V7603_5028 [Micromonosporaceae bacterium]
MNDTHTVDETPQRPSPHPRRTPGPAPASATASATEGPRPPVADAEPADSGFSLGSWLSDALGRYWMPPALWSQPAASLDDLSAYAHCGEWTSKHGALRALGIGWWRVIGLPITAACRRIEWVAQRPGRFLTVFALFVLVARSSWGHTALYWLATPLRGLAWLAGF